MTNDERYMQTALELAAQTKGQTSPNPLVGAVIVRDGEIVGFGAHLKAGGPHAEVQALRMAGEQAAGSTVYVTLEPCHHHGRTPPCTEALIEAGVRRVVIADAFDPNPEVSGKGVRKLEENDVEVVTGVLQERAKRMNEMFRYFIQHRRPFVTLKTASTLDGKIATHTGSSRWVTGEAAREEVHRLRHEHDGILVGVGTVIADDPQLTVRLPEGGNHPTRVVLDATLRVPEDARIVSDREAPTWIFTTDRMDVAKKHELERRGVRVISTGSGPRVDIEQVLIHLGERDMVSLLVEGGRQINGAFLEAQAIQKIVSYIAPKVIGGQMSPTSFGGNGLENMTDAFRLDDVDVVMIGEDIKVTGYPNFTKR